MFKLRGWRAIWITLLTAARAVTAPAIQTNLLANGSFETGPGCGWSVWVSDGGFHDLRPSRDTTTAFVGKASLKINIPPSAGTEMEVCSPSVTIIQPGTYTISLALKAANGPASLRIALENSDVARTVAASAGWQRVSVTGTLKAGPTRLMLRNTPWSLRKVTAIWIDAAQLSPGSLDSGNYAPAHPVELNLTTAQPGHIFQGPSPVILHVVTAGNIPSDSSLCVSVIDLYGDTHSLPPASPLQAEMVIPTDEAHPHGMFKATAVLRDRAGSALSAPVECVFARLPEARLLSASASAFGVHMPLTPQFFAIARAIGSHWVRLHDASQLTKWSVVQPQPGPFRYFDPPIAACRAAGIRILGMLDGAPAWTTGALNPAGGYWAYFYNDPDGPDGQKHWADYVRAMVSHYRGQIDDWEIWNEPWNLRDRFFPGTPEQYADLLKTASTTARAVNPHVTLLGMDAYRPGPGVSPGFTKLALLASGTTYFDVFSYHDYAPDGLGPISNSVQFQEAHAFRAEQAEYGHGPVRPLWTTEGGLASGVLSMYGAENNGASLLADEGKMVRFVVSLLAAGSSRFFLYTLYGHPRGYGKTDIVALEYDGSIRPQLAAYAVLASLVDGAGRPSSSGSAAGVSVVQFPVWAGRQVSVLWSDDGKDHTFPRPAYAEVLDVQGNRLPSGKVMVVGRVPIYRVSDARTRARYTEHTGQFHHTVCQLVGRSSRVSRRMVFVSRPSRPTGAL